MKRLHRVIVSLVVISVVGFLAAVVVPQPARGDQATVQQVRVINTTAQPVPVAVQGNIGGTLAATQSGTWSVGLTGGTVGLASGATVGIDPNANTVKVASDANNPVTVGVLDNNEPINITGRCEIVPGQNGCGSTLYTVPANRRLVIEHISGHVIMPAPRILTFIQVAGDFLAPQFVAQTSSFNLYSINHQTKLYFSAGELVDINAIADSSLAGPGESINLVSLTGYLVPTP